MIKYTIPQRMSGTGSIHDMCSQHYDRVIAFSAGCAYAVVLADYYGIKGYSTHRTVAAAIAASNRHRGYSHTIIDTAGTEYAACCGRLIKVCGKPCH